MNTVRCAECRHYPGSGRMCRVGHRHATEHVRRCGYWEWPPGTLQQLMRDWCRVPAPMVPAHGNVIQPPRPGRLADGTEYQRPRFKGLSTPRRH